VRSRERRASAVGICNFVTRLVCWPAPLLAGALWAGVTDAGVLAGCGVVGSRYSPCSLDGSERASHHAA